MAMRDPRNPQRHKGDAGDGGTAIHSSADRSVWIIWLGVVLLAVAALPFVVRNSEAARAIAVLCGFGGV